MINGYLDAIIDGYAHGWAADLSRPGMPVTVILYCNGTELGTTVADIYREDLERSGIGSGRHAFAYALPPGFVGEVTAAAAGKSLNNTLHAATLLRNHGAHVRRLLSAQYIYGAGVEIGALDKPMWVPEQVRVHTLDRFPTEQLRAHYGMSHVAAVDYVCDATSLDAVPDASQDFVIANHVFEHLENPLLALRNWLRVVRRDGFVFMAIPDKRFTFDRERPTSPLEHIVEEYEHPEHVIANRQAHYVEWIRLVEHGAKELDARLAYLMNSRYAIHFHCWAAEGLIELFSKTGWLGYELHCYNFNRPECIVILRKL